MDLWGYGVAFKGGSKLTNTAKVLCKLTSSGKIFGWTKGKEVRREISPLQGEPVFFKPLRELACQGGEKGGKAELSSTLWSFHSS